MHFDRWTGGGRRAWRWLVPWLLAGSVPRAVADESTAWDVSPLLGWRSALWGQSSTEFLEEAAAHGYHWNARRQSARSDVPLRFGELSVRASELFFRDGVPVRWEWTLHDRARYGEVTRAWLREQFGSATNSVQRWATTAPVETAAGEGLRRLVWGRPPHILTVEWLQEVPGSDESGMAWLRLVAEPWPPRREWHRKVQSTGDGDRAIAGVPMVDQRVQGQCAPATVERVMRYFGIPLEMATMARLAESTPDAGTNVARMMAKIGQLRGMQCEVHAVFGFEVRRFERTLHDYNAAAAAAHLPRIEWDPQVLDLAKAYNAAQPELLRKVAAGQEGKRRFERGVAKYVEAGLPLVWGVVLGIVPETGVPNGTRGGHLRLIVGHNAARHEILYTDPWGPGHELKRMSCADAWAMTVSLHVIAPPTP